MLLGSANYAMHTSIAGGVLSKGHIALLSQFPGSLHPSASVLLLFVLAPRVGCCAAQRTR